MRKNMNKGIPFGGLAPGRNGAHLPALLALPRSLAGCGELSCVGGAEGLASSPVLDATCAT